MEKPAFDLRKSMVLHNGLALSLGSFRLNALMTTAKSTNGASSPDVNPVLKRLWSHAWSCKKKSSQSHGL